MTKKKIIIFGATGSTGVYLTDYFYENIDNEKYEIIAVGRRNTDFFKEKYGIDYYSLDVEKKDTLSILPNNDVYALIILSGMLPSRMKGYEPEKYVDANIKGVLNIMEYYKNAGVDRVIYMISISDLHGYLPSVTEFTSDMPIKYKYGTDHTIYAITKTASTEIIKSYYFTHFINNYFILRLPNIYLYSNKKEYYYNGEKKKTSYKYLIDLAIQGKDLEIWGNPRQKRDIIYVKDFCQFVFKAAFAANASPGYYNVGADCMISMEDQIKGIADVFCSSNNRSRIVYRPEMPSCDNSHMNIDKARKELGYEPKYSYLEYLKDYKKEMEEKRFDRI